LKNLSRREFLTRSGMLAGCAYPAMMAMDLLRKAPAYPFLLERGAQGNAAHENAQEGNAPGKHILILGAGLAGMAAGYELGKLGYRCTLLEARERRGEDAGVFAKARPTWRPGGPNRTLKIKNKLYRKC
jgi:monoamine oxidase